MPIKQNPEKITIAPAEKIKPVEYPSAKEQELKPAVYDEKTTQAPNIHQSSKNIASKNPGRSFTRQVEGIMEEDLEDLYKDLPDADKLIFKKKGEETATYISQLLLETKIRIQEIFKALLDWLKIIPGISKAFVEQEAKIKTDQLIKMKKK
jgi:hypothetical protein